MWTVFKKEIYRVFSDKKLIFTTFFLSPLIMIAMIGLIVVIALFTSSKMESNVSAVLVNNPPSFMKSIKGIEITAVEGEPLETLAEAVKSGKYDLAFDFDPGFEDSVKNAEVPSYRYFGDLSNEYKEAAYRRLEKELLIPLRERTLADLVGGEEKLNVFQSTDLSERYNITEAKYSQGRLIGRFAPYMIFIVIIGSAMGLIMESVAGEKERGTLATQLLSPMPRERFAMGKLFGLAFHAATATVISVLSFFLILFAAGTFVPKDIIEFEMIYTYREVLLMIAVLVPSLLMNTSILMMLSSFGKNLKEASGFVMPFYMATIFLTMIPMQLPAGEQFSRWMYLIPVLGQACALTDVFAFSVNPPMFFIAVIVPLLISVAMVFFVRMLFNNEKCIVGD